MNKIKIIFFGTPFFALHSLKQLINANYNVVGIVTAPDKPKGRGLKLKPSEIKRFAIKKSIPYFQPTNLKDKIFISSLKKLNANLFVVVAFRKLPTIIWQIPKKGTINLHTSLLPNYRGAAPMNWVIINGETETGVSTFFINENIDSGNIIAQKKVKIPNFYNVGFLHDKLMHIGSDILLETVKQIENGIENSIKQNFSKNLKNAPKLTKKNCKIEWNNSIEKIHNLIRGLSPYPAAFTKLQNNSKNYILKIYDATPIKSSIKNNYGKIEISNTELIIWAIDGYLKINELQISGKKRMKVSSFLNGFNFTKNCKIS